MVAHIADDALDLIAPRQHANALARSHCVEPVIADLARQCELEVGLIAKQPVQPSAGQLHDEKVVRRVPHCVVNHAFQFFRCLCVARRFRACGWQVRRMHGGNAVEQVFFQRGTVARVC